MTVFARLAVAAAASLLLATNAFSQTRIIVSGVVTDPSGAAIPGASIAAESGRRVIASAISAGDGRYRLELPATEQAVVTARLGGFADASADVTATRDTRLDLTLQLAAIGDRLVVTAARTAETRASSTASVTVFSSEDIAALGSTSLADLVRFVPGLAVEATGREGALSALFSRGGESDYNLVLIDGVRVNQSGGAFDVSRIAASEIERVEVVRGGQSSLYGSDAMGSVIQVFTRRAGASEAPRVVGSLEGGSFNTWRGDATLLGGARNRVDYKLGVSYRGTDGAFSDLLPEDDEFRQSVLDAAAGVVLGGRASVRGSLRVSDADGKGIGPINFGNRDTGTGYDTQDLSWSLAAMHHWAPTITGTATVAYSRANSESFDRIADPDVTLYAVMRGTPGARFPDSPRLVRWLDRAAFEAIRAGGGLAAGEFLATTPFGVGDFPFESATRYRRPAFKYQADWMWRSDASLTGGYEFERERDPLNAGFEFTNHASFVQQQLRLHDRWFATVGARVDANSESGTTVSPRLSLGGFVVPMHDSALSSLKVFANAGRGIKNPQFSELFDTTFADGNSDLRPERARTIDVGAEATLAAQRVRATVAYFDNRYEDQVAFRSTGFGRDGRPDFLNIAGSKANGWELDAALQRPLAGFTAAASYAFVDTEVTSTVSTGAAFQPGQPLLRRPRHAGSIRVGYSAGRLDLHVDARYVGQRHDSAFLGMAMLDGTAVDITVNPGYTVVGLGGSYRLAGAVSAVLRIDNLADEGYESAIGYPGLPRALMVGVRFGVVRR